MKADPYSEIFLWNRSVDALVRGLQRRESFSLRSRKDLKAYQVLLKEIRAGLNADFAEAMAKRERDDETRLRAQRIAWESKNADGERK